MTPQFRFAAVILALVFSVAGHAQTASQTASTASTSGASNMGVTTIVTPTFNTAAANPLTGAVVDNNYHTNQAASLGTVINTPPVQNTCDSGGYGIGGNVVTGSALLSLPGKTEEGCDTIRDMNAVVYVEEKLPVNSVAQQVARARICKKATISAAYADAGAADLCQTAQAKAQAAAPAQRPTAQGYSADPLIAARQQEAAQRAIPIAGGFASR